jgi:hypothetical protein
MFTAGLTDSFKEQLLLGVHNFATDTFLVALYTSSGVLGPTTTVYTTSNEVTGAGYIAGGQLLQNVTVNLSMGTGYVSFDNPSWAGATFTTRGGLIYNSSKANKSVGVFNFGVDQTMLGQQFTIQFPTNDPETALIRVV